MKIGVDLDGVVSDFVSTFIGVAYERCGVKLEPSQIYVHDLFLVLGITEEEALALILETLSREIRPIEGAYKALAELKKEHEIIIITARPQSTYKTTKEWLDKNGIPYNDLHYMKEGEKNQAELNLDVFIDDNLREMIQFQGKVNKLIVFDHPWNKSLNVRELFQRALDWSEVLDIINQYSNT